MSIMERDREREREREREVLLPLRSDEGVKKMMTQEVVGKPHHFSPTLRDMEGVVAGPWPAGKGGLPVRDGSDEEAGMCVYVCMCVCEADPQLNHTPPFAPHRQDPARQLPRLLLWEGPLLHAALRH